VGEVVEVHADPAAFVHRAVLKPAVDFGRLEQVFVLLWRGPTLELLYEGEGDLPDGEEAQEPAPAPETAAPAAEPRPGS
jgi:hypothetical protein